MNNVEDKFKQLAKVLDSCRKGKKKLKYSADCGSKLQFYSEDGHFKFDYGDNIVSFFGDLMTYFKVENDSP